MIDNAHHYNVPFELGMVFGSRGFPATACFKVRANPLNIASIT